MIRIIATLTDNDIIGEKGSHGLLWKSEVDVAFFNENTINQTLVVGRHTYETLPNSAKERCKIIVLTRDINSIKPKSNVIVSDNYLDIIMKYDNLTIVGGEDMYNLFISLADEVIITTIDLIITGNKEYAYFPTSELHSNFVMEQKSNILVDTDLLTGTKIRMIFSRWERKVKRIH